MNKTLSIILIIIAVLVLAGGGLFFVGTRYAPGNGSGPGPGIINSRQVAPVGLVAVSADGKLLAMVPPGQLPENTATQKVANINVSIALSPYPPVGFKTSNFDITLTDEQGQAITDAKIVLALTMPGMAMPPNMLATQQAGEGSYHATGRFPMRGLWRIEAIIERGGKKQSAFFSIRL